MKKILLTLTAFLLAVTPTMAKNIKVEALSDFSTANPPAVWQLKVVETTTDANGYVVECGSIIEGKITEVTSPKRLKRNASFVFVPTRYHDVSTGKVYNVTQSVSGKYNTLGDITVGDVAKQGAVFVGNRVMDGFFGPGVALVEGAVKNEQGNRAKSAAVSVYEHSPLSYVNKGEELCIPKGSVFIMNFKSKNDETTQKKSQPNYSYEMKEQ